MSSSDEVFSVAQTGQDASNAPLDLSGISREDATDSAPWHGGAYPLSPRKESEVRQRRKHSPKSTPEKTASPKNMGVVSGAIVEHAVGVSKDIDGRCLGEGDAKTVGAEKAGSSTKQFTTGDAPAGTKTTCLRRSWLQRAQDFMLEKVTCANVVAINLAARTRNTVVERVNHSLLRPLISGVTAQARAAKHVILGARSKANERTLDAVDFSKTKVSEINTTAITTAKQVASDPKAQSTAVGAAGGAVAMGATGGFLGVTSGCVFGALVGLVPAAFTFGLSIPIGAVIGGGAGLCVGTAVGGSAGLVAGGAAGYKKDDIRSGTTKALAQAGDCAQSVKDKASASGRFVQSTFVSSYVRARVQSVGGTEPLAAGSD